MTLDTVWAVIVTYNGMEWIERCIGSISASGISNIAVVDNGSADGTANWIAQHHPDVTLRALDYNIGFGAGNNLGIQLVLDAGAAWVLLANQDIVFHADAIPRLVAAAVRNPNYAILSALQLTYDGLSIDSTFRQYLLPSRFYDDLLIEKIIDEVYEVPFAPAAAVLVPKQVWLKVGGFDPLFFLYCEDDDLCDRVKSAGWAVGVVPGAIANHWHGLVHRQRSFWTRVNFAYSNFILSTKRSQRSTAVAICSLFVRHFIFRDSWRSFSIGLVAFIRCAFRARAINRSRNGITPRFEG